VKRNYRSRLCGSGALALIGSMYNPAAQAADQGAAASSGNLEEVIVTGVRKALADAIDTKRNTLLVSDNITTKDIGALPDVTIAEELNRLPGVNTTRDRGNASQASVRGLGPRLVLGLVNGREVASSEPSQDLRWEIYPSEVLSGANVYKSQDASLVPGGIAATIDIRTMSPLDYKGPAFTIRGGPTYNAGGKDLPHYDPKGFRGSAGYFAHINDDLAVSLAVSAQKEKNGFPDFRSWTWNTPQSGSPGDLNGDGVPDQTTYGLNTEIKEVTQDRFAVAGSVGWRQSDNLTIKADALWSQYQISENQFQAWFGNNVLGNWANGNFADYNSPGSSYQIIDGSVVAGNIVDRFANYQSEIARYKERHTLLVTGLNAAWTGDNWNGQADLSYSDAWRKNRWEAIYLGTLYSPALSFDIGEGHAPWATMPGFDPADPAAQFVDTSRSGQSDGPEETHDKLGALTLDLSRDFGASSIKFGGRISSREKSHSHIQFTLTPTPMSLANAGLESFNVPGITVPPMVWGNFDTLWPLIYPNQATPAGSELMLQHTKVTETSYEGYGKLEFKSDIATHPLKGSFGVRVVHLDTKSDGFAMVGTALGPVAIKSSYTDVLPSLNMVLNLSDDSVLRYGMSVGISRPPLDALTTGFSISATGTPRTGGGGNPLLKPYKANQVDLSYEWYFHPESMLAVAVYYKDISTMIGASQSTEIIDGQPAVITSENNTPGGHLEGLEFTYQTRFFFLPGFLKDFGVYVNHAFVQSNIHEVAPVNNPYPMIGLARGTSEFDVYYSKGGFESRVALKHHTPFTVAPTWVGTSLKQLADETTLDASVSYEWRQRWSFRLQGHNLTNERGLFTIDNDPNHLSGDSGYDLFGRSYLLDVGLKL
jgi:iron complex outermembrane recepter protein